MKTADFDYDLPKELIAQHPAEKRDRSRLLVLHRATGEMEHRTFADLADYVGPGDVLAVNNTRVIRARLYGKRETGGTVEVLLIRPAGRERAASDAGAERAAGDASAWEAMLNCRGRLRDGEAVVFSNDFSATLRGRDEQGACVVELHFDGRLTDVLERAGRVPLPHYIKRGKLRDPSADEDAERYQTVYARVPGAVAAPTAGLHFTAELLAKVRSKGCGVAAITLHVGPGTFKPVAAENIEDHTVDPEYYEVTREAAEAIGRAERVMAVGTTTCRVLETVAAKAAGAIAPCEGWTGLFIRPPHEFKAVDCLVTNFHLPRSSLLMLVSAFAGRERILAAYEEAKRRGYRFYSYGDAMLIL